MDTIYSEAFEHLPSRQVYQSNRNTDAESEENIKAVFRKRSGGMRMNKSLGSSKRDVIQDESDGEYIDSSEVNPRIPSPLHFERSAPEVSMRNETTFSRGHMHEDSTDYQYAYSGHLDRQDPPERRRGPVPQRSVSLKDDYSQPPDRLSKSSARTNSDSQDYIEPYQSQGGKEGYGSVIAVPDTGGIYELAKDITPPPTQTTPPQNLEDLVNRQYNHLVSGTTHNLQRVRIDEENEFDNYDHVNTWQRRSPGHTNNQSFGQPMKKTSANLRQGSATPDDFLLVRGSNPAIPQCTYEDLPSEYQEPWDTEEGQKKFSRLMQRAERSDERRQSSDKTSVVRNTQVQQSEGIVSPKNKESDSVHYKTPKPLNDNANFYELAWDPSGGVGAKAKSPIHEEKPVVPPHKNRKPIESNYEDAWDTEEKQKQFEEKLEQVRRQRLSEGKISDNVIDGIDTELSKESEAVFSPTFMKSKEEFPSIPSPVSRRPEREFVSRSDSCKSLAALAEKIDRTIPLVDQSFYHGSIKRSDAERMLCVFKDGSYLIRRSESNKKDFSLTLKGWNGTPMHMKITSKPNGTYILGENSPPFQTIPEMVEYYTRHELPVQNAERICLLYPIPS